MIPYVLLQMVAVPLVFSVVVFALGGRMGKKVGWVAFASLLYTTVLMVLVGLGLFNGGQQQVSENYVWAPVAGLDFGFLADNLSLPVALVMNIVVATTAVYSMDYMKHRLEVMFGEEKKGQYSLYFINFMLLDAGLIGVALATNLIELYLFVELMLIPSAFMVALFGYTNRERTAIMYFLWNHLGAFIFFAGIILAYIGTKSFEISSLGGLQVGTLAYWAAGLILLGWLVKMAVFGVHMWLPTAHAEHPTSFAPFIVTIVGVGNYVVVRLLVQGMPTVFAPFAFPLMVVALVTMVYGGVLTMVQNDVKYLYAWSTISQNAYSLLGIGSLSLLGVSGGIFYFLNHIIGKTILFCVAGILISQVGTRDMRKMGGLAARMPITATLCVLGSMILSAVPPTGGFQGEWILFAGVFSRGTTGPLGWNFVVAIFGIAATILTVAYTFWPLRRMFFGALPAELAQVREAPLAMTVPLLVLAALSIAIGIYPDLFFKFLYHYASMLPLGGH
ncbi:MAG: proton-conducting transporter membrane subunit [Thaumarchaeota archaeon]|nr:proton-conducting transporter membrane subunit [Nitrososphaerota archaeon]